MKKTLLAMTAITMTLVGCAPKKTAEPETTKSLVLYYSQTGTTKAVAEEIQKLTGADLELVVAQVPYDGTYSETIERCQKEREAGEFALIEPLKSDLNNYDTIYVGYPVWFGTFARPMETMIKSIDLSGKKVIPFCTFGSGGLNTTSDDLRRKFPQAEVLEGYGVRTARIGRMPKEIDTFMKRNGYIQGEVQAVGEFSEQKPVTEAETAIFNAACGDYQFPLGTPLTFGSRDIAEGREYKFTVAAKGMDSSEAVTTIFVIDYNEEGAKPEFTQVVR